MLFSPGGAAVSPHNCNAYFSTSPIYYDQVVLVQGRTTCPQALCVASDSLTTMRDVSVLQSLDWGNLPSRPSPSLLLHPVSPLSYAVHVLLITHQSGSGPEASTFSAPSMEIPQHVKAFMHAQYPILNVQYANTNTPTHTHTCTRRTLLSFPWGPF